MPVPLASKEGTSPLAEQHQGTKPEPTMALESPPKEVQRRWGAPNLKGRAREENTL